MGTKLSKSNKGEKKEDEFIGEEKAWPDNFDGTSTLPASFRRKGQQVSKTGSLPRNSAGTIQQASFDRSTSFSKRFRKSCRNWAAQRGLVGGNTAQQKKDKVGDGSEPTGEAYGKSEITQVKPTEMVQQDVPEVVVTEPEKEMDLAAIVATMVVEAHKKKMASRAQSRAQSREALLDHIEEPSSGERSLDKSDTNQSECMEHETLGTLDTPKVDAEVLKSQSELFNREDSEIIKQSENEEIIENYINISEIDNAHTTNETSESNVEATKEVYDEGIKLKKSLENKIMFDINGTEEILVRMEVKEVGELTEVYEEDNETEENLCKMEVKEVENVEKDPVKEILVKEVSIEENKVTKVLNEEANVDKDHANDEEVHTEIFPSEEVHAEEVHAEEVNAEGVHVEEVKVEQVEDEQVQVEQFQIEEVLVVVEDVKAEEVQVEEDQVEDIQVEDIQDEDFQIKEVQVEEVQVEEVQVEEVQVEEVQIEEVQVKEVQVEEVQVEEVHVDEVQVEEVQVEEVQVEEVQVEEVQVEEVQVEEVHVEKVHVEEVKVEEVQVQLFATLEDKIMAKETVTEESEEIKSVVKENSDDEYSAENAVEIAVGNTQPEVSFSAVDSEMLVTNKNLNEDELEETEANIETNGLKQSKYLEEYITDETVDDGDSDAFHEHEIELLAKDVAVQGLPNDAITEQEDEINTIVVEEDVEASDKENVVTATDCDSNTDSLAEVVEVLSEPESDKLVGKIINDIVDTVTNDIVDTVKTMSMESNDESGCESLTDSLESEGVQSSDDEIVESDDVIEKHVTRDTVSVASENECVTDKLER